MKTPAILDPPSGFCLQVRISVSSEGAVHIATHGVGGFSGWVHADREPELYHHLMAQIFAMRDHARSLAERPLT